MSITQTHRRAFAARVLLKHLAALSSRIHGVKHAEDIEYVHQMRVASRRLRNALDLFEDALPGKLQKRWLKQIKRVTKSLGAARDTDVQIVAVRQYIDGLDRKEDRKALAGAERLLLRLTQKREAMQDHVVASMERLEAAGVLEDMRGSLMAMKVKARLGDDEDGDEGDLHDAARDVIALRLEQVLAYEPFVHDPQHVEELHAMRIAAKHLRYTMEAYAPLFDDKLKKQIKTVKQIQTLLGDIHDCDVWLELIPRFIEDERERQRQFFGHLRGYKRIETGLQQMLANRRAQRERLYKEFIQCWDQHADEDTWTALRDSLDGPPPADKPDIHVSADADQVRHGQGSTRRSSHGSDPDNGSTDPPRRGSISSET